MRVATRIGERQGDPLAIVREAAGVRAISVERVLAELTAMLQPERQRA